MGKSIEGQFKIETAKDTAIRNNAVGLPETASGPDHCSTRIAIARAASIWPHVAIRGGAYVGDLDVQKVCHAHAVRNGRHGRLMEAWKFCT